MAAHLLQAAAREAGCAVDVLYANHYFARLVGLATYERLLTQPTGELVGERLFSRTAFGQNAAPDLHKAASLVAAQVDVSTLIDAADFCADAVAQYASAHRYAVVGSSTTFEQTVASLAILKRVKEKRPGTITLLGGANCEGPMALGLSSVAAGVDFLFSGECESAFREFLCAARKGRPDPRLLG